MKVETPATGIMKTHDFGDAMYYAVSCQCGNPDDMINFSVELEVDSWNIVLNTEFTPKSAYWKTPFKETLVCDVKDTVPVDDIVDPAETEVGVILTNPPAAIGA
mgnify:CR=1 FL=1